MNPDVPIVPRGQGTINIGWGHERTFFTNGPETAAVFSGVRQPKKNKQQYLYIGHYQLERTEWLGPDEWRKRSGKVGHAAASPANR